MIGSDINVALTQGGQSLGGWDGAFRYWDTPLPSSITGPTVQTVGQYILSRPVELEKFIACSTVSVISALQNEFAQFGWGSRHEMRMLDASHGRPRGRDNLARRMRDGMRTPEGRRGRRIPPPVRGCDLSLVSSSAHPASSRRTVRTSADRSCGWIHGREPGAEVDALGRRISSRTTSRVRLSV